MNSNNFFFENIFNLKYNNEVDETIYYDEECISKCYPKNELLYDISNSPYIFDKDKCSILPINNLTTKECKSNNFIINFFRINF